MNLATMARLWAERRAGELLESLEVPVGNRYTGRTLPGGVTKKESHRMRKLAAIPEPEFQEALDTAAAMVSPIGDMVEQRRGVVVALREQGHSLRAIGGALGVDHKTVANDLQSTGEGSPVPDRVVGLDGKSRPARRTVVAAKTPAEARS